MLPILYAVIAFALVLVPGAVTLLKGQVTIFVAGILFAGSIWIVAACRLARPGSWWARRVYDGAKLRRAHARYGGPLSPALDRP